MAGALYDFAAAVARRETLLRTSSPRAGWSCWSVSDAAATSLARGWAIP
jgi:hypothetical protein